MIGDVKPSRNIFNALAVTSLLLYATTAVLWLRSYAAPSEVWLVGAPAQPDKASVIAYSKDGQLRFVILDRYSPHTAQNGLRQLNVAYWILANVCLLIPALWLGSCLARRRTERRR